jgi:tetratricopeptide (TPR) repeat protein
VNAHVSCLILFSLTCASPLRADQTAGGAATNSAAPVTLIATGQVEQATAAPVQAVETVTNPAAAPDSASQAAGAPASNSTPASEGIAAGPVAEAPHNAAPADEFFIWVALAGVLAISLGAIIFTWQTGQKRMVVAQVPAVHTEPSTALTANLLPLISLAVKEALVQELSTQRRELLASQQAAAAELAGLARRLELIQAPLLERLGGTRPPVTSDNLQREIPVKIYCACGQKYAFEIQPVAGRMPFAVACPACGQDGTHQANQFLARILNGTTQLLPSPGTNSFLNSSAPGLTPQIVDALKQAVVKELAATRAEAQKIAPIAVVRENHAEGNVANLVAEGQTLADAGELDRAVKWFEAALVLQPDSAEALVKLAGVLDKQGRADEALQIYDRAIAADDSLTIAYLNKGGLFNRLARHDEALRCYEQALLKQKKSAA